MLDPICNINLNLLYVKGRSDLVLKLEIIKKTIAVSILVASLPFGLVGLCVGRTCYGVVATILNMTYTRNFIELSMWGQAKLVMPSLFLSLLMAAGSFGITLMDVGYGMQLILGTVLGIILYLGLAKLFGMNAMNFLVDVIKKKIIKK